MGIYANATYVKDKVTEELINFMQKKDYHEITVSEIILTTKIGRSSFYRNFENKEDILKKYLQDRIMDWRSQFEAFPDQDFSESLIEFFYADRAFCLSLYRAGLSWMLYESIKTACGVQSSSEPYMAYGASAIAGAIFGWVNEWISRGMKESPSELQVLRREYDAAH